MGRVGQQSSWTLPCFFLSPCLLWRSQAPSSCLNAPSCSSEAAHTVMFWVFSLRRKSKQAAWPLTAHCCRQKSLAAKAQPFTGSPARNQAPTFPHPKLNFQPRAILGGSHLRYRTLLQQNYGTTTGKKKAQVSRRTIFSISRAFCGILAHSLLELCLSGALRHF